MLKVAELFSSIQGEGTRSGAPCSFIRLSGCALNCAWCDTAYAREFDEGEEKSVESLVEWVESEGWPMVCVTGGEPLLQAETPQLLDALLKTRRETILETSGAVYTGETPEKTVVILDVKCPSSGMEGRNLWENMPRLRRHDEVKFVLADRNDYEYAREVIGAWGLERRCAILLSPVRGRLEPSRLVEWILADRLPARLSLQLHKILWPASERGK